MDISEICEALKDLGVMEVILDIERKGTGIPTIEFNGKADSEYFKIVVSNKDFSDNGL